MKKFTEIQREQLIEQIIETNFYIVKYTCEGDLPKVKAYKKELDKLIDEVLKTNNVGV